MRRIKFYNFASALMLASAMGLSSCSSDSAETEGNPGVAGETVKTLFAINIPRASSGSRATAAETQGDGNTFLGMKNISLLGFDAVPTDNSTSISSFGLEAISKDGNDAITGSNSNKIYQNVAVNVGTSHFIFYGFGDINDDKIGAFNETLDLSNAGRKSLSEISFALKPIVNSIDYTTGEPKSIIDALNTIDANWKENDENLKLVKQKLHTFKAGSANSVCALLQDLLDYIDKNYQNVSDALTQFKAKINSCNGFCVGDDNKIKTTLTFPANIGLPDGAVSLNYTDGTVFAYKEQTPIGAMSINPTSITYPALLSYYVSSPIYTNSSRTNTWPTPWTKDGFTGWTTENAKVDANTAAIALSNSINYGVASLKMQVKCKTETLDQGGSEGKNITVPTEGFKVTGLLIGNQPDKVDYKFAPTASEVSGLSKTIYDSKVNLNAKYTTDEPTEANYTIVLPNMIAKAQTQENVMFALELVNNSGVAFEGYDGIVEKDAKFYLVGTLKTNNQTGITKPTDVSNPSVFMSDYQTEVVATISSLKNAYNTIPDIRTTSMQLGLNVDLKWQKGYQYNIEIGGDNN